MPADHHVIPPFHRQSQSKPDDPFKVSSHLHKESESTRSVIQLQRKKRLTASVSAVIAWQHKCHNISWWLHYLTYRLQDWYFSVRHYRGYGKKKKKAFLFLITYDQSNKLQKKKFVETKDSRQDELKLAMCQLVHHLIGNYSLCVCVFFCFFFKAIITLITVAIVVKMRWPEQ